jgi:hypothetical protein
LCFPVNGVAHDTGAEHCSSHGLVRKTRTNSGNHARGDTHHNPNVTNNRVSFMQRVEDSCVWRIHNHNRTRFTTTTEHASGLFFNSTPEHAAEQPSAQVITRLSQVISVRIFSNRVCFFLFSKRPCAAWRVTTHATARHTRVEETNGCARLVTCMWD